MEKTKLAEMLKKIRKARNMTQEELALMVGFKGKGGISKIERGVNSANYDQIDALCKALNVRATQLFGYEPFDAPEEETIRIDKKYMNFIKYLPYLAATDPGTLLSIQKLLDMPPAKKSK